jgi:hypothetical protein
MTVLLGEAAADFVTERGVVGGERDGTEDVFESDEWMISRRSATLEDVGAAFTGHDDRVATIGRLARPAEIALKIGEGRLHVNQII